jgi:glyoxylase-like metal-dependent hydrolase (beta-lactamase superfamily II)
LADPAPGHPEIERIVAPNPGPMTLEGTNTYVVATADGVYVIDPGPDDPDHLAAVREAAEARGPIAGVLLTHGHSDHTAGVEAFGEPVLWGTAAVGDEAAGIASSGIPAPDPPHAVGPFGLIPTPGHAADHVCFVLGDVCFCGDLILGAGSSIVPPRAAGGSLTDYMRSLERVGELGLDLLAPGHGPWITDPKAKITEYTEHRLDRERRLVAALDAGERSRARLVETVWDDVPEPLRPAAAVAMQAHLEKLIEEGRLEGVELSD